MLPSKPVFIWSLAIIVSAAATSYLFSPVSAATTPQPIPAKTTPVPPKTTKSAAATTTRPATKSASTTTAAVKRSVTVTTPNSLHKVVNGKLAVEGQFPWLVAFLYKSTDQQYCGGTIIDLKGMWILTAAHCFSPLSTMRELRDSIDITTVVVGEVNLRRIDPLSRYEIDFVIPHPEYNMSLTGFKNDIALVKLKGRLHAVPGRDGIDASPLPSKTVVDYEKGMISAGMNAECYVAGWGGTEKGIQNGKVSSDLLYAQLDIFPFEKCKENYRLAGLAFQGTQTKLRDYNFCASDEKTGRAACHGDSGGGLFCKDQQGAWAVYGIVSFGLPSRCGFQEYPSVYTEVYKFLNYLNLFCIAGSQTSVTPLSKPVLPSMLRASSATTKKP